MSIIWDLAQAAAAHLVGQGLAYVSATPIIEYQREDVTSLDAFVAPFTSNYIMEARKLPWRLDPTIVVNVANPVLDPRTEAEEDAAITQLLDTVEAVVGYLDTIRLVSRRPVAIQQSALLSEMTLREQHLAVTNISITYRG